MSHSYINHPSDKALKSGDIALKAQKKRRYDGQYILDNTKIGDIIRELESGKKNYLRYNGVLNRSEKKYIKDCGYKYDRISYIDNISPVRCRRSYLLIEPDVIRLKLSKKTKYLSARTSLNNYKVRQEVINHKEMDSIMRKMESGKYDYIDYEYKLTKAERKYLKSQNYKIFPFPDKYRIRPKENCF